MKTMTKEEAQARWKAAKEQIYQTDSKAHGRRV